MRPMEPILFQCSLRISKSNSRRARSWRTRSIRPYRSQRWVFYRTTAGAVGLRVAEVAQAQRVAAGGRARQARALRDLAQDFKVELPAGPQLAHAINSGPP